MLLLFDTGASSSMLERKTIDTIHAAHPDWLRPYCSAAGDADMLGGTFTEEVLRVPLVTVNGLDLGPALFVERPTDTWPRMFGVDDAHGAPRQRCPQSLSDAHRLSACARCGCGPSGRPADALSLARARRRWPLVRRRQVPRHHYDLQRQRSPRSPLPSSRATSSSPLTTNPSAMACIIPPPPRSPAATAPQEASRIKRAGKTSDVTVPVRDLTQPAAPMEPFSPNTSRSLGWLGYKLLRCPRSRAPTRPHSSTKWCQSRPLRASREASKAKNGADSTLAQLHEQRLKPGSLPQAAGRASEILVNGHHIPKKPSWRACSPWRTAASGFPGCPAPALLSTAGRI